MTIYRLKISLFFLLSSLFFIACSDDDDDNGSSNNQQIIQSVNNNAKSGTWKITQFIDSGQDELSNFSGYTFTFGDNGVLTATNGQNTLTGTWSVTNSSDSNDDSPDNDVDFNIFFNVDDSNPFEDLNDDWDITSQNASKIELIDISGGNGGTDLLTFEKN